MTTTTDDIDLTPPENTLDRQTIRYLHENFSRIKELLDSGGGGGGGGLSQAEVLARGLGA